MVTDNIKMKQDNYDVFDKKEIALAIRNSTYEDEMNCSLLKDKIIKDCDSCSLKTICEGIEEIRETYIEKTIKVVSNFIL